MGCSVLPTKKQSTASTFNQIRCSSPVKKPDAEVALIKLSNGKLEELVELPGKLQALERLEPIGDHFGGLEAISVETLNHTNVAEAIIQVKRNLCGFIPSMIEIADEKCGTFFLNYGDIEVLCPPPKVKGELSNFNRNLFVFIPRKSQGKFPALCSPEKPPVQSQSVASSSEFNPQSNVNTDTTLKRKEKA
uniref:Uncharacterized protein n=1 Tax=Cucumis melo TaxID=3656 RepID=A0A9I9D7V6_CUCME